MTIQFYMDVHIRRSITEGLRRIGLDVLTAQKMVVLNSVIPICWIVQRNLDGSCFRWMMIC